MKNIKKDTEKGKGQENVRPSTKATGASSTTKSSAMKPKEQDLDEDLNKNKKNR